MRPDVKRETATSYYFPHANGILSRRPYRFCGTAYAHVVVQEPGAATHKSLLTETAAGVRCIELVVDCAVRHIGFRDSLHSSIFASREWKRNKMCINTA